MRISAELSHICPLDELSQHATALEGYGFHRVWVPDTVVSPWEAWLAASLVVHHTTHLHIGLGVTNPYTRHPVVMAQMAATLQHASGGRLTLSLGKGTARFLEKAGIRQDANAVAECVAILRGLIAGERTSFAGTAFQIDAMLLRTCPPQTPVPLYLAAIGRASWDMAMRIADGIATVWTASLAETRRQVMTDRVLPTAVLIPFAQRRDDFFAHRVTSLETLRQRVMELDAAGCDEAIVAYADLADLDTAARLLA
jgi:5,10-methylenetetrahydromethanopterin reductase